MKLHPLRLGSELTRLFLFPALQYRWHRTARRQLRQLRRFEHARPEAIRQLQWKKLTQLLRHAVSNVPYYRNLLGNLGIHQEVRSPEEFARIPILNKDIIRAAGRELLAEGMASSQLILNASGGSTGKPLQFYQDGKYWDYAYASQWFVESWWGIRPGDPTASIWGTDRDLPKLTWKEKISTAICQEKICNAFAMTEERMEKFAKMVADWQPRFIVGYASALSLFARFVKERPSLRIRPHAAKSAAEVLSQEERAVIEAAFQCPVYDFYGSREVNNLAAECPAHQGLHVNALGRYFEILDTLGEPVSPGGAGRIVITDLTNYAMPFIRYEIEDIGTWSPTPCTCGRPFPLLAKVLGRKSDFIVTPSGKLIHGEYFTHIFYGMPEVTQFQLIQDSLTHVRMRVVLKAGVSESILESLRKHLGEVFGSAVTCEVAAVSAIERPPSGKHRFTISNVPVAWGHQGDALQVGGGEKVR